MKTRHIGYKKIVTVVLLLVVTIGCLIYGVKLMTSGRHSSKSNRSIENVQQSGEQTQILEYEKNTQDFVKITAKDILENKIKTPLFLYVGKKTCLHCQEFVPVLKKAAQDLKLKIYYLDSEKASTDAKLKEVGKKYQIEGVPTLLRIDSDNHFEMYSGDSDEELLQWMKGEK